jgi:spore coat protein A, manganese oxidase
MRQVTRRQFMGLVVLGGAGAAIRWQLDRRSGVLFPSSPASIRVLQTPLPGSRIPQFVEPLTTFAGRRVAGSSLQVGMLEFQQRLLPSSTYDRLPAPYNKGSFVWGYAIGSAGSNPPPSFPGVTIEAREGTATTIQYVNRLPRDPVLRKYFTIDQTVHWADPLGQEGSVRPYSGPIPLVPHLHGAQVQSTSDGAPEAWFTSDGLHGPGYSSFHPTAPNAAIYQYPNHQEARALWFHDHALGITRISIFAGLAAFYLIRDQYDTGLAHNPLHLPAGDREVELMIQDRQFDTNGQLLFPDSLANPSLVDGPPSNPKIHPYWIPEFFGDAMLVNGRTWPFLNVEPRRYRFRIVNACNARFTRTGLVDAKTGTAGPPMYQIGTDGGMLDTPVRLLGLNEPYNRGVPSATTRLFLAPSERADIIIDFANQEGKTFTLTNDSQVPFPSGPPLAASDPTRKIMQFRVNRPLSSRDGTYDPAGGGALRGGQHQERVIVRLANPSTGTLASGVKPDARRQLVLVEIDSPSNAGGNSTGTPVIDLVNNTKWGGRRDGGDHRPIPGSVADQTGQDLWLTELPRVGSTELWEFLNLTPDVHPIHLHLVQFQLLNRQPVSTEMGTGLPTYMRDWTAAFPGGTFNGEAPDGTWGPVTYPRGSVIPGYGPPRDYFTPNADGALGGNPAFGPYLSGPSIPPNPNEAGWKDVLKVFPSYVTRFVIRWAPQTVEIDGVRAGQNRYPFDPTRGPGYLVHCHILDHEDNEMMRPYILAP